MKSVRQGIVWGALWGLAEGFWLLAPLIVSTHYITVRTAAQALGVIFVLSVLFIAIGAGLGLGIAVVLKPFMRRARSAHAQSEWPVALMTGLLLLPAYIAAGCLIYIARFGRDGTLAWSAGAFKAAIPAIAVTVCLLAVLHFVTRSVESKRTRIAAAVAGCTIALGIVVLVIDLPDVAGPPVEARGLAHDGTKSGPKRRLIVIGIDGGTWRTIEPLLKSGRLPNLRSLADSGVTGNLIAQWPPYWSTTSWSAIITGFPREEVGVFGDLVVDAPGLPAFQAPLDIDPRLVVVSAIEFALAQRALIKPKPPNRNNLRRPPIWEMLEKSGVRTGLVRFNFSHPPRGLASVVISNRVVDDVWDLLGVKSADPREVVWPKSRRAELLEPFSVEWTPDEDELGRILGRDESIVPEGGPVRALPMLKRVLNFDQRTIRAASRIVKSDPDLDVMMIHFGGLDNVQHVFWQYRFPDDFARKLPPRRVADLAPVIDHYIEFLDRGIGEILRSYPERPNVMVISDHGMASFEHRPPFKAWHGSPGIFLAAGPDFQRDTQRAEVTYYDIVPTILDLEGLERPAELRGRSLAGVRGRR